MADLLMTRRIYVTLFCAICPYQLDIHSLQFRPCMHALVGQVVKAAAAASRGGAAKRCDHPSLQTLHLESTIKRCGVAQLYARSPAPLSRQQRALLQ